jgi:predicted lipoprotein with Yx(FWY)xxD motif
MRLDSLAMRELISVVAIALLLTGCGSDDPEDETASDTPTSESPSSTPSDEPAEPADTPPTEKQPATGTVVTTADSEFGEMLFDKSGQAIYLFDKETSSEAACYDACAEAWPPVLTEGDPQPQGGVTGRLLGTTKRADGSTQVTYGGHPLYYYAHEGKNEVLCHNVSEYGGLWLVVTPTGEAAPA